MCAGLAIATVIQIKNLNEIEITFQIRTSEFDLLIKYYSIYIYLHVTPCIVYIL